jgi:formamidopyrimidine-DNA glycosylase
VPELPEVETIRRQLAPRLVGREVVGAGAHESPKFATAVAAVGGTVTALGRRGKYLIAELESEGDRRARRPRGAPRHDRCARVHDRERAGTIPPPAGLVGARAASRCRCRSHRDPHRRGRRAWGRRGSGVLTYTDVRRFGRTMVVPHGDHTALPTLARLGPEPLGDDFTPAHLRTALRRAGAPLKAVLLGQRVVAGIGNIYCDEACWRQGSTRGAGRSRPRGCRHCTQPSVPCCARGSSTGARRCATTATGTGRAAPTSSTSTATAGPGSPCRRCGTLLERSVVAARGTTTCPSCQPRPAARRRPQGARAGRR